MLLYIVCRQILCLTVVSSLGEYDAPRRAAIFALTCVDATAEVTRAVRHVLQVSRVRTIVCVAASLCFCCLVFPVFMLTRQHGMDQGFPHFTTFRERRESA